MAIGSRTDDHLRADVAAATRPILDDEWLTQSLGQPLAYQAARNVGRAGGAERHDEPNRPRRISLRPRDAGHDRQRGKARG